MNILSPFSNEQKINKDNVIIPVNEIKNSYLKKDDCSELIHEITQKEMNNNENSFTGTKIFNKSNEMNNSSK